MRLTGKGDWERPVLRYSARRAVTQPNGHIASRRRDAFGEQSIVLHGRSHRPLTPRQFVGWARGRAEGRAGSAAARQLRAAAGRGDRVHGTGRHAAGRSGGRPARPDGGRGQASSNQLGRWAGRSGRARAGGSGRAMSDSFGRTGTGVRTRQGFARWDRGVLTRPGFCSLGQGAGPLDCSLGQGVLTRGL